MKKLNNKGFSLVELIIVIAIMAILVGVMAPQLMKYIEKSRYSSDVQFFSSVDSALKVAMANESAYQIGAAYNGDLAGLMGLSDAFAEEVREILGGLTATEVPDNIKSIAFTGQTINIASDGNGGFDVTVTSVATDTDEYPSYPNN